MSKFFKAIGKACVWAYTWYKANPEQAKQIEKVVKEVAGKIIKK